MTSKMTGLVRNNRWKHTDLKQESFHQKGQNRMQLRWLFTGKHSQSLWSDTFNITQLSIHR